MKTDKYLAAFGRQLQDLRKNKNLTQEELGARAGLDRTFVSSCERGQRNISLLNIYKLADALKIEPGSLLQKKNDK